MGRFFVQAPVLLLLILSGCAAPARSGSTPRSGAPPTSAQEPSSPGQAVAQTQRFSLYSDPWINLHHFLYQWAVASAHEGEPEEGSRVVQVREREELPQLAPEERRIWTEALDYYQREVISRELVFDANLIAAKARLSQAAATNRASLAELPPRWREVLESAMRVYEKHWWPQHDRTNRTWIQSLAPKLQTYEATLTAGLVRAFGGTLPAQPDRLDASAYADRTGAYTTPHPNHTIIVSNNPDIQGFNALEIAIHEFSHLDELERPERDLVARAFTRNRATPPRDLWHAVIFFTACDLTREALRAHGIQDYQCYADRAGLLRRTPRWQTYWQSLEAHWKPFLEGQGDGDTAAGEVARDLSHNATETKPSGHAWGGGRRD